jgi:hypothetical protein
MSTLSVMYPIVYYEVSLIYSTKLSGETSSQHDFSSKIMLPLSYSRGNCIYEKCAKNAKHGILRLRLNIGKRER